MVSGGRGGGRKEERGFIGWMNGWKEKVEKQEKEKKADEEEEEEVEDEEKEGSRVRILVGLCCDGDGRWQPTTTTTTTPTNNPQPTPTTEPTTNNNNNNNNNRSGRRRSGGGGGGVRVCAYWLVCAVTVIVAPDLSVKELAGVLPRCPPQASNVG